MVRTSDQGQGLARRRGMPAVGGTSIGAPAASGAPVNSVAPAISGAPTVGQTLSVSNGTWSNSPTGFVYQWKRGATAISGANASSYLLVGGDAGNDISATVTATNASGSGSAASNSVTAFPVLNTLQLSGNDFTTASASGTLIGAITGKTAGTTLSVSPNDGRVTFNGAQDQLIVGLSASTPGMTIYTITETPPGGGLPKSTSFPVFTGDATASYSLNETWAGGVPTFWTDASPTDVKWANAQAFNEQYGYGDPAIGRALPYEWELYLDPTYHGVNPFSVDNGDLLITIKDLTGKTGTKFNCPYTTGAGYPTTGNDAPFVPAGTPYRFGSGMVSSKHKLSQLYGSWEADIALPAVKDGAGNWLPGAFCAFWLYDQDTNKEIDIFEWLSRNPQVFEFNELIAGATAGTNVSGTRTVTMPGSFDPTAMHTYKLVWTSTYIAFFIDGVEKFRKTNALNVGGVETPMYLYINYAVRDGWDAGDGTRNRTPVDPAIIGTSMRIGGIRVQPDASVDAFRGVPVGALGGGDYAGFTLTAADDFLSASTRFAPADNPTGRYGVGSLRGHRRISAGNDVQIFLDPYYRGARSSSPSVLSAYDRVSFTGGAAVMTISAPETALLPYLPTTGYASPNQGDSLGRPKLAAGQLCTFPHAMFSAKGDFIIEGIVEVPATHIPGLWVALWTTTCSAWPDFGEIDINEIFGGTTLTSDLGNVIVSNTDGGGSVANNGANFNTTTGLVIDRPVWWRVRKVGSTVYFDDDIVTQGTLANRGSYTDATRVGRLRGGHDIRMQAGVGFNTGPSPTMTFSNFDGTKFPAQVKFHGWAMWTPSTRPVNTPLVQISTVQTTPGGSWAATIPSTVSIWGSTDPAPDLVEAIGLFDNGDAPGCATRNSVGQPGGMTITLPTSTVAGSTSGTVPTTEGGRVGLFLVGSYTAGGAAKRAVIWFNVAPVAQSLFTNQSIGASGTGTLSIAYADFHSGNLGPHTYTVTSDKAWATVAYGVGNQSATISYAGPGSADTATITVACTNAVGQTTTVVRTIEAAVAWTPASWTNLLSYYDPNDNTKVFKVDNDQTSPAQSVVGTDVVGRINDKKATRNLTQGNAARRPAYVVDGGRNVLSFTATAVTNLLRDDSAAYGTTIGGNDVPFSVVMLLKRGPPSVAAVPWSAHNTVTGPTIVTGKIDASNNVKMIRSGATAGDTTGAASLNEWMVLSWVFSGTTVTIRKNGVTVANAIALDTASITVTGFVIGADKTSTDNFDALIDEFFFASDGAVTSDIIAAETYLMGLRGL